MKLQITQRFKRGFQKLTKEEQQAFQKQIELLLTNPTAPFHPSLRIKFVPQVVSGYISGLKIKYQNVKNQERRSYYP